MPAESLSARQLHSWCAEEGFARTRSVRSAELPGTLRGRPDVAALGEGTFLLAALSCYRRETEDLSTPGDPHGLIAPFARRNYYREAVERMRQVARRLGAAAGVSPKALRIFSNSTLPEKALSVCAGLGAFGRNTLVLAPPLGSLFVIAGMFVPAAFDDEGRGQAAAGAPRGRSARLFAPGRICGACHACQEACPVGALEEAGRLDEARCLQAQAGVARDLPEQLAEAWGFRLYGCQLCQEVCPFNRRLGRETPTTAGELGPSLSLRWVLGHTPEELAGAVRGTALGMSWIDKRAILRNALLALGHRGGSGFTLDRSLLRLVDRYSRHRDPVLAHAAAWAAARWGGCPGVDPGTGQP